MEVVTENSNAAVADTGLHADSVPSGASTLGAVEGSVLGAQPRSPSLEPRVITLASSSQFYPSVSSYTIRNMSVAVAESSPRTFFSSSPVTSVLSCASSAMEAQVPTIYSDSTCFSYENQELYTSTTVTLPATNARMFGFSGPSPDTSTEFERRTQYAQQDIHPMYANSAYASSETAPAMSAAESHPQFVVQPSGTTSEVSPSLHAIEGYYGGETSASQCISLDSENPSLSVVADGNDDPTSLRVIDDSDDPTLLRSTDALEDLSLSHTSVPPHSAEHSSIAVELPPQSCITAEELPPPQVPAETTAEVLHPLRNVNVAHSSAHSERPVAASSDLSSERSSWPSTNPTSGTSTIMSPFIVERVELSRKFTSQSSSSLIIPKIEADCYPLLCPKKEPKDNVSPGSAFSYGYYTEVVMVAASFDPNSSPFTCPDLKLYASSPEPSSPSCSSPSGRSPDPAYGLPPDIPELGALSSSPVTKPSSTSLLDPHSSDYRAASTLEEPSACSLSPAMSYTNVLTPSPCDSGNGAQYSQAMDCGPSLTGNERVENCTVDDDCSRGSSRKGAPPCPNGSHRVGADKFNSRPPPLPCAEVVPRGYISTGQKGRGWPYAPQGWPNLDDKWSWRVGRRGQPSGFYKDRFLGLPMSLVRGKKLVEFASKRAIVGFLKQNFPHLDVDSFFKAFQWRIPCVIHRTSCPAEASTIRGEKRQREAEVNEHTENPAKRSRKQCGAGNLKCGMETGRSVPLGTVPGSDCDICCIEPGFCRECTCILCCQIIVPDAGDCNLVRCMHRSPAGGICGHGAHLECALKSQMAGVVKERDLDMEYLCRRCDSKTDLRELVTRLLEAVGNTLKRSVAEKCLQLALQIMKGTEHGGSGARVLESLVQTALEKVQRGVDIQEVFSDLKDQGMAAEAAKQQCLSRATSHGEDVSQQPEASLDQWLPSHNSPSSHPSPGTPSSFSSPIIRRNASVNSRADGTEVAEACNHAGVEGHTDESEEAIRSPERKLPGPRSNPSGIKSSQVRVSSRRARAGSSTSDFKHEATFQSQPAARNGKHQAHESGSRSPNLRTKSDQKGVSFGAGMQRDEPCKSCGATRPASQGLEVTSGLPSVKAEVEVRKSNHLPPTRKEVDLTTQDIVQDAYDVERHTEHSGIATQGTSTALVSSEESRKALGVSLVLLDDTCQQQVQSVLQKLRQAQQAEFLRAQERLIAQKDRVLKRYELLETARCEFDRAEISSSHHLIDFDRLMLKLSAQLAKASEERQTFDKMLKVAGGFGRLSRDDLNKYYDWPPEREVDSRD